MNTGLSVRRAMFPYGMRRNPDGTWTLFNRQYKPLGVVSPEWAEWDDPRHKIAISGLGPAKLAKLDHHGVGLDEGDVVYFYNDGCLPDTTPENLEKYLDKLRILIRLR